MKDSIKLYLLELCCSYTIVSVAGALINMIAGTETNNVSNRLNQLLIFQFYFTSTDVSR